MRILPSLVLATALFSGIAHAADPAHDADVAAIGAVVEQFKAAIVAHDGKTLGSLFLPDHDSWVTVADTAMWNDVKARHPDARKVMSSSRQKFIEFVQSSAKPIEECFTNVRIETNGAVGSVYFDFDFLSDGKVTNRGSESWQMVRAEDGWKISSMLYSMGR